MVNVAGGGGGSASRTLSITQMYALARKAGLSTANAVVAAAIGMAESSGRTAVTSPNPDGGTNVGIWQLDTKGKGAGYTVAQLQDPATNAKAMAKGSANGTNWSAWATYGSGAYRSFISQAQSAAKAESSGGTNWLNTILGGLGGGLAGAIAGSQDQGSLAGQLLQLPSQITDFLTALEKPVQALMWFINPGNWARIVAGVFGFLLLGAGLVTLGLAA